MANRHRNIPPLHPSSRSISEPVDSVVVGQCRPCPISRQTPPARFDTKLLLIQIMLFQEFGPEILWRSGEVWPALWREVHQIPIRPHCINMIRWQLSCPEVKNLSVPLPKHMHHRPLHIVGLSLAFVVGLEWRVVARYQRNLRPSTLFRPRIDFLGGGFSNSRECGVLRDRIPGAIKPIHK